MRVSRGDTYFIHYPNSPKEHLFVIISPVEEMTGNFLIVGIESAEDKNSENLVFLFPGDFPFIRKKTSIAYRLASIMDISKLEEFVKKGYARPDEPMDLELVIRIGDGLLRSTRVDDTKKEFYSHLTWKL
jgi:hypothetical protein